MAVPDATIERRRKADHSHDRTAALEASKALFIRRWGEMGGYWGINRTMAEIHALLFVSTEPVCTDDVMEKLLISRGNASMNLRSLVDWGLIQRVHIRGDRKEYFVCTTDVWQMFETIIRQRSRREVEPILETIERCQEMVSGNGVNSDVANLAVESGPASAQDASDEAQVYRGRLAEMEKFLRTVGAMVDMLLQLGPRSMSQLSGMMAGMSRTMGGANSHGRTHKD